MSSFPYLDENEEITFPPLTSATEDGILCMGGNLSPGILLSAYKQGIFPWYSEAEPILWWSPDPRFVLLPCELHISSTMKKVLKKHRFHLSMDTCFKDVINNCACTPRPGQDGTWIVDEMIEAYLELHKLGYAHSIEAWNDNNKLVGGFYGVSIGKAFFGESMFSLENDASKAAFIPFVRFIQKKGFSLIDSQVYTDHVSCMGGKNIERCEYIKLLQEAIKEPSLKGNWSSIFADFCDFNIFQS